MEKRHYLDRVILIVSLILAFVATMLAIEVLTPEIAYVIAKVFNFQPSYIIELSYKNSSYGGWAVFFSSAAMIWGWCFSAFCLKSNRRCKKEKEEGN